MEIMNSAFLFAPFVMQKRNIWAIFWCDSLNDALLPLKDIKNSSICHGNEKM